MSEGNTVYNHNLLRSSDILWGNSFSGTAQKIVCSRVWVAQIISSEAFARIFKPGHTYTLSCQYKIIEPAPDTYYREDRFGLLIHENTFAADVSFFQYHDNPTVGCSGRISETFTLAANLPSDTRLVAYSDYSRDENGVAHIGILEISDLMIVEGSTPAAWAPAEGETLTADGGGGGMTEPTSLVKTQPDETATYTVKANDGHKDFTRSVLENIKLSANTSCHIGITIKPDKDIPSRRVWAWIVYRDDAGAENFANSSAISYVIPAGVWTRLEWTVTVPAGMTLRGAALSINRLADETKFQATNFVIYPLTGGRIVRARGTTALVSVNDGAKGDQGIPGKDGKSPTVSVSKSGTVTTIVVTNADGSKTTQTVNDGVNGTPGAKGADGKTPYFHVKYSNDGGKTFTANSGETVGTYIGTCTDYNSSDPTSVSSYTWARIKGDTGATGAQGPKGDKGATGPQGPQGVKGDTGATGAQGPKGADGISPTVSVTKSGTKTTISITDKTGTHTQVVNDGTNGTPGAKGADGKTPYFHVKYSNDGGSTFTSNSGETVGTYIGTYTDYNSADPTAVSAYTWARIKGDTGATGAQGPKGDKGATGAQGPKGATGDTGISVTSTVDEWYLSTSSGSLSGGSWSDKRQAWASGKYYWRRIKTTYSDGRTSYTPSNNGYYDAVITDAVAKANDAYSIADGKNAIYYSDTAPAGNDYAVNDIWFDTKNDNAMHYWDGSRWLQKQFGTTAVKDGAILADKLAVNSVTSDKILAGAINADKIAANAVSLGNLDSTLVTSNILGASVSNLSTWHGTDEFISAATMTYSDDYMTSFSYTGVANWEHAYYIVNGLCNDEQYTVSFEFDAPNNLSILVGDAGYIPFCIFTEAGFSSRKTSFKSGDLATIQIPPTAGNHRYSVSFTAKSTVIMAFNFGQLADGVQMTFSVGKFKLESGYADTGWVVPRGLYLDNDELRINADSIRTGTLDAINITGSTITGGTIAGNTITGGTISGTTISGNTITGGTISGTKIVADGDFELYFQSENGITSDTVAALYAYNDGSKKWLNIGNGADKIMPWADIQMQRGHTITATNFIGNWNGLSADFSTHSSGATWIPVFNNMKLQHTLPNDIANLAGCARVRRNGWGKTLDCDLKHGIVLISNYRAYLFWYAGTSPNMSISYKAIYGGDANTTFTELNKTGTGNCWRITVKENSTITVIGGYL